MKFAVLVSGHGTNLQALLDAQERGDLAPAEIVVVLSNRPGAAALDRASRADLATAIVDHKQFENRAAFERAVCSALAEHDVEAVVLAGFMRVLTETFLAEFPGRVINTHPSLLPAFPGMHGAKQALEYGCKITGCTIHLVEAGVDTGPIILQAAVPIEPDDDENTLQQRIQEREHQLLPVAARLLAADRLRVVGRRVHIE